ncbi:MAG: TonB-dependent receptor [Bryobacteraceae bacterium]|nr:TonB-dependent receptor [Bryobacteraceae bacterium]
MSALPGSAARLTARVVDSSGAGIPAAEVAVTTRTGILQRTVTDFAGRFTIDYEAATGAQSVLVAAPGFRPVSRPLATLRDEAAIELPLAAQTASVTVAASLLEVPTNEQPTSTSVIPLVELRGRNEANVVDLLRYIPGLTVVQNGPRGAQASLFARGGDADFNLVLIDGVPVNRFGGYFDLAALPTDFLERAEVIRGPQSAVFGSYANSAVVNLVSRTATRAPSFDLLAEGGNYGTRRFSAGAAGTVKGFGVTGSASKVESDGEVANSDFRGDTLSAGLSRQFGRQAFSLRGFFNSNELGAPGPWGSNPAGNFGGLDRVSRGKTNASNYYGQYRLDANDRFRQEFSGGLMIYNSSFRSIYGDSVNNDRRGFFEGRSIYTPSASHSFAFGAVGSREEVVNSFITNDDGFTFPLSRSQAGIYVEHRYAPRSRFSLTTGLRTEIIATDALPPGRFAGRPPIPGDTITRVNPKIAANYYLRQDRQGPVNATRLHATFGTGIRPAEGFELAYTDNPRLRPERTMSFDVGLEQRLFDNRLSLEATVFRNEYDDLIVSLGGALAQLSRWRSDNLSNALARGAEFETRVRPARWLYFTGQYTWLQTEILALDGSAAAQSFFRVGQPLLRRPRHSGSFTSNLEWKRLSGNVTFFTRGHLLDVEPNFGASAGLYRNPGYHNLGLNLNYRVTRSLTAYSNFRNVTNQRYEEAFGYPSLKFNFVSGVRWNWQAAQ